MWVPMCSVSMGKPCVGTGKVRVTVHGVATRTHTHPHPCSCLDVSDSDVSGMNIAYLLSTFICRIFDGISLNPFNAI